MKNFRNLPCDLPFVIATGFLSGLAPKAPGTVGSIAAIPFWILLCHLGLWNSFDVRAVMILAVLVIGTWASVALMRNIREDSDPQHIVIDEWVGMLITFLPVARPTPLSIVVVLFWFRLFDIWKPGPISWAEKAPGGYGVMADDCVAGAMASVMVMLSQMGLGNI